MLVFRCASIATREFTIHALPLSLKNVQRYRNNCFFYDFLCLVKVWNCDDCRTARGMKPLGNIKKFRAEVADLVKKAAAKSFFANRSMLGYEDSDSLDAQVHPL